jgi:glycosyltransferase involved in cell wall biosynthesis
LKVVYAGRLDEEKRVDLLLRTAKQLRDRVSITVVGESTQSGRNSAHLARVYPDARFLGRLPRDETVGVMADNEVFVSPARGESFGRTIYEAALLGLGSVVDSSADAARTITDGTSGWVLGGATPWSCLAPLLARLQSDREAARAVGAAAKATLGAMVDSEHARQRYWDALSDQFSEGARRGRDD